jgi:cytochrome c peroxidase
MTARALGATACALLVLASAGCDREGARHTPQPPVAAGGFTDAERAALLALSPKPPLPADPTNRFAGNGQVACATCHVPALAFANGQPFGQAIGTTARHVPSLWNTAYNRWWFWDGRADSAWAQALGPLEDESEHGGSRVQYARVVHGAPDLRSAYEELFGPMPPLGDAARFPPEGRPDAFQRWHPHVAQWKAMSPDDQHAIDVVASNIGKALAAYERRLVGGPAPFDVFVEGLRTGDEVKLAAIPEPARRGARLFVGKARCTTCHHGPLLTDFEFHDLHLASALAPPRDTGRFRGIELLRMDPFNAGGVLADARAPAAERLELVVQQPENWGQFKTPSLRNVALTAPYMHDGRFRALEDVLHYYRTFEGAVPPTAHAERTLQRLDLTDGEQADLVAFLEALTEERPGPELTSPPPVPLPERCRG